MFQRLWHTVSAAPHRLLFLGGVVQAVAVLCWWAVELAGRYTALWPPLAPPLPPVWGHAFLMLFGVFPFFMLGFLMTTYPRWMSGPEVPRRWYAGAFALMAGGAALVWAGLLGDGALLIPGIALHLAGWATGYAALLWVYRRVGPTVDRRYERHLNAALAFGLLAEALFLAGLLTEQGGLVPWAIRLALWLFLVPVLVVVAHRMIPFFSSCVLPGYRMVQPRWSLPLLWVGVVGHVLLEGLGWTAALALPDALLLFIGLYHSWHWGLRRSLAIRLLAALHIAFAWFSVAMVLYLIQDLAGGLLDIPVLGRAPLHALGIGFITGMAVAMVTRVSRGHSGRPLLMDRLDWGVFLGIQAVALLRIWAELPALAMALPLSLNLLAALVWLSSWLPFALRYGGIFLRPRIDGKPG